MIDLRSDTVSVPTEGMRKAMLAAPVGDDVYADDPSVNALQEKVSDLFGHEAALFCATGSLANLLAVRSVVPVGTELLCEANAHIVRAELGSHAAMSGVTTRTWTSPDGRIDPGLVEPLIAPDSGPYLVRTSALAIENTHNFAGGAVSTLESMQAIRSLADDHGLKVHLDGARIWNASVASGTPLAAYGATTDVMAVCLSKGLGAPVGSLVLGSAAMIAEARQWRKRWGGGWRQAGMLAAAGAYAIDHHVDRLAEDHDNARVLAEACGVDPDALDTNIVVVPHPEPSRIVEEAATEGVLIGAIGPRLLRMITHVSVSADDVRKAAKVLASLL